MGRQRLWVIAGCALAITGCPARRGEAPDFSAYRAVVPNAIVAWAWGGAAGYRGKDAHDVHVVFRPEADTADYRLLGCDSKQSPCDTLTLFEDLGLKPRATAGGLLAEFLTDIDEEDQHLVVIARRGGELLSSDTIVTTIASRPTGYAGGGLVFEPASLQFIWPRMPDAAAYVLAVSGEKSAGGATVIVTRRRRWAYPEIQGIVQHFHDPAATRDLQAGRQYTALLLAINPRHWVAVMTDLDFKP